MSRYVVSDDEFFHFGVRMMAGDTREHLAAAHGVEAPEAATVRTLVALHFDAHGIPHDARAKTPIERRRERESREVASR